MAVPTATRCNVERERGNPGNGVMKRYNSCPLHSTFSCLKTCKHYFQISASYYGSVTTCKNVNALVCLPSVRQLNVMTRYCIQKQWHRPSVILVKIVFSYISSPSPLWSQRVPDVAPCNSASQNLVLLPQYSQNTFSQIPFRKESRENTISWPIV